MKKRDRSGKSSPSGRDAGGFIALPWSVIDSAAYMKLSPHAKCLLIDAARQFVRDNNGRLLLSMRYLKTRGWNSCSMVSKAKKELLDGGFLFETVKGHRPNKASWYAITWQTLDKLKGYDTGAELCFRRGAYAQIPICKNKLLTPSQRIATRDISPQNGAMPEVNAPPHGAIRGKNDLPATPLDGNHLDITISREIDEEATDKKFTTESRIREDNLRTENFNFINGEFSTQNEIVKSNRQASDEWVAKSLKASTRIFKN